jgi:hypothetical protein
VSRGGYVLDVGSVANTFEALGAGQELVTDAQNRNYLWSFWNGRLNR